jgi:hypothetical protein
MKNLFINRIFGISKIVFKQDNICLLKNYIFFFVNKFREEKRRKKEKEKNK